MLRIQARRLLGVAALLLLANACALADEQPGIHAVATAHPLATAAGHEVLAAGGNAFDAAVTVSAVLAVVEPYSSGFGGGGFWLLHRAADGHQVMLDGRERAPLAARRDMYLDEHGEPIPGASLDGPLAAGIPGQAAALAHLAEHYGRLPLAQSLQPAIRIAREGFAVDAIYRRMAGFRLQALRASPAAATQFLVAGEIPPEGSLLRQPDLARTLERLARHGHDGFYQGPIAEAMVAGVSAAGGIWSPRDLAEYQVVEREPIRAQFGEWRITSASPPSAGGVLLAQMLHMLAALDEAHGELPADAAVARAHRLIEVMRRAYRERARWLGDPDQVKMPIERLTHPFYAAGLVRDFDPKRATPSAAPVEAVSEGLDTTHFSILDAEGNRVAATLSVNYPFGACFVPPGTGVLLNDEMDDFSKRPGVPNAYGLIGGEANAIAPGKRMLSSMSPTFVESAHGVGILGTPGGSRIITMVLRGILALADGRGVDRWVAEPRLHHQYLPDRVQYEVGALDAGVLGELTAMGHRLEPVENGFGNMQAIFWDRDKGTVQAASDPRGIGSSATRGARQ